MEETNNNTIYGTGLDYSHLDDFNEISEDNPLHPSNVDTTGITEQMLNLGSEEVIEEQKASANEPDPNILSEGAAAIAGGAADAVESVGGIADLTGDTLKAGFAQLFGNPVDDTENPFSGDYEHGTWLDIPDDWVPENKTALGKLTRGFVEFGLLTAATGGVGSATLGGVRLGVRGLKIARSAGVGARGTRYIKFLQKTAKIAAEGGVADLISSSSEDANLANLVDEFAPWMPLSKALSVDPEDNPWLARIKTVTAGAGVNLLGWRIASYAKGRWAAKQAHKAGKTIDEANDIGNKVDAEEFNKLATQSEEASTATAAEAFVEGSGISHALPRDEYLRTYLDETEFARYVDPDTSLDDVASLDEIANTRGAAANDVWDEAANISSANILDLGRKSHPKVNPGNHLDVEKADLVPDEPLSILRTSIKDLKSGGTGRSWKHMWTQYGIKRMTGGSARRLKILEETRDKIVAEAFQQPDNTMSYNDLLELTNKHVADGLDILMDGKDIANRFKKLLTEDPNNYRVYMTDGVEIKTITPAQKGASQLLLSMLADTQSAIAQSGYLMADNVPINTQFEQVMDATKALIVETKRAGMMWGLDGVAQQLDQIPGNLKDHIVKRLKEIDTEADDYFNEISRLKKENRVSEMKKLMEIHAITGGKINTLEHLHDYINKSLGFGTHKINGLTIKGQAEQQLLASWYNSILSSLRTPIKAIAGTNMIAILRPFQAYLGASLTGNKTEMVVAASMIDSLKKAWSEGMDMFWYNWDAGVHKKSQSYNIRYDLEEDLQAWKNLGSTIQEMGTESQKRSYAMLDSVVDINTSPWVKYSTNAMGAGDALARTVVGRFEMRQRAIRQAIEEGVDLDDAVAVARSTEENFRKQIFKEGKDGKWVVHDKAATMAGDEAAMTRNLEGFAKVFDDINRIPVFRAFFPFVRTGVNALNLTFEHVPGLARTQRKFRDILSGEPERLAAWGIRPEDAGQARALIEGRLAMGKTLMGMSALWTLTGNMTGDYPYDKEQRDLWKLNNIPPYSVKVGDTWVSYRHIEPFNTVASIASNLVINSDVLGESVVDEWIPKLGFMFSAVMIDKTMLSGVKELFAVADMEQTNRGSQVARVLASKFRPIVPYAGLSKDIGNILDDVKTEAQSLGEMLIQRDALMKTILYDQYDILSTDRSGKAFKRNLVGYGGAKGTLNPLLKIFNAVSPVPIIPAEKIKINGKWEYDPVKKTLEEMRYNLPEILNSYKGIVLNSRQRSRLQYHLSTSNLRKDLERIILPKNSIVRKGLEEYKKGGFRESQGFKLSDTPWYDAVHDVFTDHVDSAIQKVMAEDRTFLKAVEQRERNIAATKTGNTSRMKYEQLMSLPK